jgi:Smg protein
MYDVLVYLFEHYFQAEIYPDPDQLARKLSAVGFEDEDISDALNWLSSLQETRPAQELASGVSTSVRLYDDSEIAKLDAASRGFLVFLETAGAIDARMREIIIERAMELPEPQVSLPKFKVIALMVLWSQHALMDSLIIEELLGQGDEADIMH